MSEEADGEPYGRIRLYAGRRRRSERSPVYTPMHRALGRAPSELTYELLQACVAARVPESESLDWKQTLPHETGKRDWREEWAKDVAAMANTGGGCIVYGVSEEPGTGVAAKLEDVGPVDDDVQTRLRQSAAAQIHPLVAGLQFLPVTSPDGLGQALVVRVPASPDVPHLLRLGNEGFKAPHRYGPTTEWMTERALEDAYRRRFRRVGELVEFLDRRYAAAERHARHRIHGAQAWFVGAGVPVEAQPEIELTYKQAADRLQITHELYRAIHGHPVDGVVYDLNVVPGLRRLTAGGDGHDYQTDLHFDGTVTVIERMRDAAPDTFTSLAVPTDELESSVLRLVASIAAAVRSVGIGATYAVTVGIAWKQPGSEPLYLARPHPMMTTVYRVVDRPIHEIETSTREVRGDADVTELRAAARALALDLLRQGGLAETTFILDEG
jgi:hypothetical protein